MAGKSDLQAGSAFVRLWLKDELTRKLAGTISNAGKRVQSFGFSVLKVGATVTGAGASIIAPFVGAVKHFAEFGDTLDKMSSRTGIGVGALAELGFAAEQSGQNLEVIEKAVRRMQKTIGDADRGLSTATDGLAKLGTTSAELGGMLPEQQFEFLVDRLRQIEDPTQRASAAMDVFGSRVGTAILPMVDSMKELRQEARDLGIVPTEAETKKAAAITDAINRIKRAAFGAAFAAGSALADAVLTAASAVQSFVVSVQSWIRANPRVLMQIASVGVMLVSVGGLLASSGVAIIGLGMAIQSLGTIIGSLGAAISLIATPVGAIVALLGGSVAAWALFTEAGRSSVSNVATLFGELFRVASEAWQGIVSALLAGDLRLAGEIAMAGLQVAASKGLAMLSALVGDTIGGIVGQVLSGDLTGAWETVVSGLGLIWASFTDGIVQTMTAAANAVINVWEKTVASIAGKLLDLTAQEGIIGTIARKVVGVDPRKQPGMSAAEFLDGAKGIAKSDIKSKADSFRTVFDKIAAASQGTVSTAAERFTGNVNATQVASSAASEAAEKRLAELTERAAKAGTFSLPALASGITAPEFEAAGLSKSSPGLQASFSAAALSVGGFGFGGGGPQERIEKLTREHVRVAKQAADTAKEIAAGIGKFINVFTYG